MILHELEQVFNLNLHLILKINAIQILTFHVTSRANIGRFHDNSMQFPFVFGHFLPPSGYSVEFYEFCKNYSKYTRSQSHIPSFLVLFS